VVISPLFFRKPNPLNNFFFCFCDSDVQQSRLSVRSEAEQAGWLEPSEAPESRKAALRDEGGSERAAKRSASC